MARARITLKMGDQKRFLKFTIATMVRYDDEAGQDGAALNAMMANPMTALLKLSMFALDYPENTNNLPDNFNQEMASDWIDDLNEKDLERLINTMMEALKKFGAVFQKQSAALENGQATTPSPSPKNSVGNE